MEVVKTVGTTPGEVREVRFVNAIIKSCEQDKGLAARLRRADNPATEYQSWDLLATYGVDLEKERERLPFVTIAAAIAKAKAQQNGKVTLGKALAVCYDDGRESNQAKARLRRLLACTEISELVRHLRPVLTLINSKSGQSLDYQRLLKQLRSFSFDPQRIKAQWAQEFYNQPSLGQEKGEQA